MAEGASSPRFYEYIVVGCGGVGSGALYWLAKQTNSSKYARTLARETFPTAASFDDV